MSMDYIVYNSRRIPITPFRRTRIFDGDSLYSVFQLKYVEDPDKDFRYNSYFLNDDGFCVDFFINVPCGKCDACKKRYIGSLRQRARFACEECDTDVLFVTLSYNNDHLPAGCLPSMRDVQLFKKRLSELCRSRYGVNLKYFVCSEIGSKTGRPHYHMLIYNFPNFRMLNDVEIPFKIQHFMYCWRENERDGKHMLSFPKYVSNNYRVFKQDVTAKDYDSKSFGFVSLRVVNSIQASSYVSKYVSKHATDKRLFKSISVNLGLGFAMKYLKYAFSSPDRSFSYVSKVDGKLTSAQLCSYYLKKLLPTKSVLFPTVVRRSIISSVYFCRHIIHDPYGRFSRSLVRDAFNVLQDLHDSFPDFEVKDMLYNSHYKNYFHEDKAEFYSESFCKFLVNSFVDLLNAYKAFKIDLSYLFKRDDYFRTMVNSPCEYAAILAKKFRKERSNLIARSKL